MKVRVDHSQLPKDIFPTPEYIKRFIANCTSDFRREKNCIYWNPSFKKKKAKEQSDDRLKFRFSMNGKQFMVKKIAYAWFTGVPLKEGKRIKNTCGDKYCINPRHLYTCDDGISTKTKDKPMLIEKLQAIIKKEELTEKTGELLGDDLLQGDPIEAET